jgi:hypothetical protein
MWVVENNTPFEIERGFLRDRTGDEVWIAVIRGTFELRPSGRLYCTEKQNPPKLAPVWAGDAGVTDLLDESDLVLTKRATDVLVRGHVYAPGGNGVSETEAGFRIGSRTKVLRVYGTRVWMKSSFSSTIVPGPALRFDRVPISYQKGYGGIDEEAPPGKPVMSPHNSLGTGFSYRPAKLIGKPAPQFEYPGDTLEAGIQEIAPAGFGPIASFWHPRITFAGTYDEAWQKSRAPLLPEDFDDRFYQSAPADQQIPAFLSAGEKIELFNLSPSGYFCFRIPELTIQMQVIFTTSAGQAQANLHTVLIEPDQNQVQLTWHAAYPCPRKEHLLTEAVLDWEGDKSCLSP